MPRKITSMIKGVVRLRQRTEVESKSVAKDIKSNASAIADVTEQLMQ